MILTSELHAEHPFAGQNTQHVRLILQLYYFTVTILKKAENHHITRFKRSIKILFFYLRCLSFKCNSVIVFCSLIKTLLLLNVLMTSKIVAHINEAVETKMMTTKVSSRFSTNSINLPLPDL